MTRHAALLWIVLLLGLGCTSGQAREPLPAPYVEYGGCATVLDGRRCVLRSSAELRLWVRADPGAPIRFDDGRSNIDYAYREDVDGGTHFRLTIADDSRPLRVRAVVAGEDAEWTLNFARDPEAPELSRVRTLFNNRQFDEAEAQILRLLNNPEFAQAGLVHRLAGIFYHNRGAPEKARDHYEAAVARNLADGRWLDAFKSASSLSYLLQQAFRDFAGARAVYAPFVGNPDAPAEALYFEHYDRGLLGFNTGDARTALRGLSMAATHARRMGSSGRWLGRHLDAEELLAAQLQRLGRRNDADRLYRSWQARDLASLLPCEQAMFKGNVGWNTLLQLEAGDVAPDPTPILGDALEGMREHCSDRDIVGGHINLALAHVHAGRFDAAAKALEDARAATLTPTLRLRFWELDIAARLAMHDGRHEEAMATLAAMEQLAEATLSPDARWRAAARRGLVLERLGRDGDALAAYAAADQRLLLDLASVPFYAGRGPFAATRDWVTRRRLSLLQRRGDHFAVAQLVRDARRRAYRDLGGAANGSSDDALAEYARLRQSLDDELASGWRVPRDELAMLRARHAQRESALRELLDRSMSAARSTASAERFDTPKPGDLLLLFHPQASGWLSVAVTPDGATSVAPDCAVAKQPADELARCLLAPHQQRIAAASRLLLMPHGALDAVDFHALPVGGSPLLSWLPVVYSLDTDGRGSTRLDIGSALLVSDPTRQLPASRQETVAVADLLADRDALAVHTLTGRAATYGALENALAGVDLLHFAGHAEFRHEGGWDSALALAHGGTLSVSDVFGLPRTPRFVVLSACETARTQASLAGDTVGLAQAFVLRGAQAVLATGRTVRDDEALRMMTLFYAHWRDGLPAEDALRRAQLAAAASGSGLDWSAYRLLVR